METYQEPVPQEPNTAPVKRRTYLYLSIIVLAVLVLMGIAIAYFSTNKPLEVVKENILEFIDPNGPAYLSLNDVFPVSWKYDPSFSGSIDLVLISNRSECVIAENLDIATKQYYWVPRLKCPIVEDGTYILAARANEATRTLGVSDTFRAQDRHEVIEGFALGERFVFEEANMSFELPDATQQVLRTTHQSENRSSHRLSIFFGSGRILVTADGYFAEWTGGVPVSLVASSTFQTGSNPETLEVYTSSIGTEGEQSDPFAIVFIDTDSDGESDVMIEAPYASNADKTIVDTFLRGMTILD